MKVCPIVNVRMKLKDCPPMSLVLYVVPTICEPITGLEDWIQPTTRMSLVDMLIG